MMAVDIIVVCLLLVTIFYCWKLNQKIVELQNGKAELARLFKHFDNTIVKADKSMHDLRLVGQQTLQSLERKVAEANQSISAVTSIVTKLDYCSDEVENNLARLTSVIAKAERVEHNIKVKIDNLDNSHNNLANNIHHNMNNINNMRNNQNKIISTVHPNQIIKHSNKIPPMQGGIEALASKTIPVYANKTSDDVKRQAIETLLERISKTQSRHSRDNAKMLEDDYIE